MESEYTFAEIKKAFEQRDKIFENARMRRNEALTALQEACTHSTVVGGNEEYGDVQWRVCVTCGLVEHLQYYDDPQGKLDYDGYVQQWLGSFKVMPYLIKNRAGGHSRTGTRAYKPEGGELEKFSKYKI